MWAACPYEQSYYIDTLHEDLHMFVTLKWGIYIKKGLM
jgi:hypothetical protein